jgi:hypothetical protein
MNKFFLLVICVIGSFTFCTAQQKFNPKGMNYLIGSKPNNIIYNDSVFRGSNEFKHLFYRTGNPELLALYSKHQSNKIVGQTLGFVGAIGILVGINNLNEYSKRIGWTMIGGGLLTSIAGGYFTLSGQRNLQMAIAIFNQQYNKASIGIGIGDKSAGLVYKF